MLRRSLLVFFDPRNTHRLGHNLGNQAAGRCGGALQQLHQAAYNIRVQHKRAPSKDGRQHDPPPRVLGPPVLAVKQLSEQGGGRCRGGQSGVAQARTRARGKRGKRVPPPLVPPPVHMHARTPAPPAQCPPSPTLSMRLCLDSAQSAICSAPAAANRAAVSDCVPIANRHQPHISVV